LQKVYTQKLQEKQEILLRNEAELSTLNNTKDKLFSIIAHDLKGPINSFRGLLEMHTTGSVSKEEYDIIIPKALQGIQGISEMLNNLLVWARTQMLGTILNQENIDVNELVQNTVSILNTTAKNKKISLVNTIPKNTISYSDRNHLRIIIRNLIGNAIKFTNPKGEILISSTELDTKLQITVADNGIGMNAETLEMLFTTEPMKSTFGTNNEKGTGLGLLLCKEMAESNGGELWVSSVLNKGTTIYFTVPLKLKQKETI
ncbi:HAMP domain-containing histidine kinase, partial [bacterium]|nr:HAMP domain-containing histidine kinase [bacterium]